MLKRFALLAAIALPGFAAAQTLQTVTTNGNTTNTNILLDPGADAFRSLDVYRLNGTVNTMMRIGNNKANGALCWIPNMATPSTQYAINLGENLLSFYNNGTTETIWRSGNMGAGSTLNADMVDGVHAGGFSRYGAGGLGDPTTYAYPGPGIYFNGTYRPTNGVPNNNYGTYIYLGILTGDQAYAGIMAMGTNDGTLYTKRKAGGTWETSWRTIWDSNNFTPSNYLALTGGSLTGDLTIGNNTTQQQLNVNGNIKARKVKVTVSDWPDFVFDSSYQLMPLSELGTYIAQNRHLPEVPSAAVVKTAGVELGESQAAMLKKIEELTLYILAQEKKQEELESRLKEVEEQLAAKK